MSPRGLIGLLVVARSSLACTDTAPLFLESPWPEGERVVLAFVDANGNPAGGLSPRISSELELDTLSVIQPEGTTAPLRIVAQRYPVDVQAGAERCGVTFGGQLKELGPAEMQWEAALGPEDVLTPFSQIEVPEDLGLKFESCTPELSECDQLMTSVVSISALDEVNIDGAELVDQSDYVVFGGTESGDAIVARLGDSGAVATQRTLPAHATSILYAGSAMILGLTDGSIVWLDPHSLETEHTAQLFSSNARVDQRDDGLNIAYSEYDDRVLELKDDTSTATVERSDFPPKMLLLHMQAIRDMAAAFPERPPALFDPPNNRWVDISLERPTENPHFTFTTSGLYLTASKSVAYLPRSSFGDPNPAFTPLELPGSGGPVTLTSVSDFREGVLVGGYENSLFYFDVDGDGCVLTRDVTVDSGITEIIVLNDGRAIGFTTNVAGIGSLSPRIVFIGPK